MMEVYGGFGFKLTILTAAIEICEAWSTGGCVGVVIRLIYGTKVMVDRAIPEESASKLAMFMLFQRELYWL
jgi:hypothetical protein